MTQFKLRWRNPSSGREFTADYTYDPTGPAKGHTLQQWIDRCIAFGKREGLEYLGRVE